MNIYVNGDSRVVEENCTAAQLLETLGLGGKRVAMESNGEIVPRSDYDSHIIRQYDKIEIVHAIGGG